VRAFRCPNCGQAVPFEAQQCPACAVTVGYHLPSRTIVAVPSQAITVDARGWVRCAHWGRGCNWLAAEDSASDCCYADSFVREAPATDDIEAMAELGSTPTGKAFIQFGEIGRSPELPYLHTSSGPSDTGHADTDEPCDITQNG
jgi:hypothetical protein